jgi:hypothetical protein
MASSPVRVNKFCVGVMLLEATLNYNFLQQSITITRRVLKFVREGGRQILRHGIVTRDYRPQLITLSPVIPSINNRTTSVLVHSIMFFFIYVSE